MDKLCAICLLVVLFCMWRLCGLAERIDRLVGIGIDITVDRLAKIRAYVCIAFVCPHTLGIIRTV